MTQVAIFIGSASDEPVISPCADILKSWYQLPLYDFFRTPHAGTHGSSCSGTGKRGLSGLHLRGGHGPPSCRSRCGPDNKAGHRHTRLGIGSRRHGRPAFHSTNASGISGCDSGSGQGRRHATRPGWPRRYLRCMTKTWRRPYAPNATPSKPLWNVPAQSWKQNTQTDFGAAFETEARSTFSRRQAWTPPSGNRPENG